MKTLSQLRAEQQAAGLTPHPPDDGEARYIDNRQPGWREENRQSGKHTSISDKGFCKIVGGQGDAFLRVEGQSIHPDFHTNLKGVS